MNKQEQERLDSLTGLRFWAAMMVFANHMFFSFPQLNTKTWVCDIFSPLGIAGVCFFYVLSGFILTYVYSSRGTKICLREFYLKRIARIWPLHLVTMLIVLFGVETLRYRLNQPQGLAQIFTNAFLVHAWWPDYLWVFAINAPSWSLSNEAFFYLLFPWLVAGIAFRRKFIAFIIMGIVAIIGLSRVPDTVLSESTISVMFHINPLFRTFDFMLGMAFGFLYLRFRQKNASSDVKPRDQHFVWRFIAAGTHLLTLIGSIAFYLFVCLKFGKGGMLYTPDLGVGNYWVLFGGAAPAFAITIFAYASISSWVSRIFSSKIMIYLGEISFAFYLIHQPIIVSLSRQEFAASPYAVMWLAVASFFLSLAASMLLHHIVELPSRAGLIQMFSMAGSADTEPKRGWLVRFGAWLAEYAIQAWRLCVSLKFLALVGFTIAGYLFANAGIYNFHDASRIQEVISQSEDRFKGVQFDQDAVLQGVKIDPLDDGSYRIQLVWELKAGRRPVRFLHIVGSSGKILRQGNNNPELFSQVTGDDIVLDQISLSKDELESAVMLAIGFYCPERNSAQVVNSLQGQPTHRLPILHIDLQETP